MSLINITQVLIPPPPPSYRTASWTENIGVFLYSNSELYELIDVYVTYGTSFLRDFSDEMLGGVLVVELDKRYNYCTSSSSKSEAGNSKIIPNFVEHLLKYATLLLRMFRFLMSL